MKKVILDTNAVMDLVEFKIDLFAELGRMLDVPFQICVVEGTRKELEGIVKTQRLRFAGAAKTGLALLQAKKVNVLPSSGKVDDILAEYSRQGALILTQDRELKQRLARPFLTIRQKKVVVKVE